MLAHLISLKQDADAPVAVSNATLRKLTKPLVENDRVLRVDYHQWLARALGKALHPGVR